MTKYYYNPTNNRGYIPGRYVVNVNIKMYKSDKIKMYNYSKLT